MRDFRGLLKIAEDVPEDEVFYSYSDPYSRDRHWMTPEEVADDLFDNHWDEPFFRNRKQLSSALRKGDLTGLVTRLDKKTVPYSKKKMLFGLLPDSMELDESKAVVDDSGTQKARERETAFLRDMWRTGEDTDRREVRRLLKRYVFRKDLDDLVKGASHMTEGNRDFRGLLAKYAQVNPSHADVVAQRRARIAKGLPMVDPSYAYKADLAADEHQLGVDMKNYARDSKRFGFGARKAWDTWSRTALALGARFGDKDSKDAVVNYNRYYNRKYNPAGERRELRNVRVGPDPIWETDWLGNPTNPMMAKSRNEQDALERGIAVAAPYQASRDYGAPGTSWFGRIRQKSQPVYARVPYPQRDDFGNIVGFGAVPELNSDKRQLTERMIPGAAGAMAQPMVGSLAWLHPLATLTAYGTDLTDSIQTGDYTGMFTDLVTLGLSSIPGGKFLKKPISRYAAGLVVPAATYAAGLGLESAGVIPEGNKSLAETLSRHNREVKARDALRELNKAVEEGRIPVRYVPYFAEKIQKEYNPTPGYWNTTR